MAVMDRQPSLLQGQYQARIRWNTQASGAAFDRKKRSYLSTEAREFIAQRIMCVIAGISTQSTLDGQLAFGQPGFAWSPDQSTCLLELDATTARSDLMKDLHRLSLSGKSGQIGLFFINHATRERLCVHGDAELLPKSPFASRLMLRFQPARRLRLHVQQAFFHCPKYIRTKIAGLTVPAVEKCGREQLLREFKSPVRSALSAPLCDFLRQQVSCFICTANHKGECAINHRGGAPGFLTALLPDESAPGGMLLLPDYAGNGAFEAVGNILETGYVTLVVPDYSMQQALSIFGAAQILEPGELGPDLSLQCIGAERVIALAVQRVVVQSGDWSLPLAHEQAAAMALLSEKRPSGVLCSV